MIYETLLEYVKSTLYPKELKNKNILYHSTYYEYFIKILKSNKLYGSTMYDSGIATSRNRDYAFGMGDDGEPDSIGNYYHNLGEVQLILDRDKIKPNYKIKAFDWEEMKSGKHKTGEHGDTQQSEDKIITDEIVNIHKYIIGFQIIKNKFISEIDDDVKKLINKYNWIVYDEEWNNITNLFQVED